MAQPRFIPIGRANNGDVIYVAGNSFRRGNRGLGDGAENVNAVVDAPALPPALTAPQPGIITVEQPNHDRDITDAVNAAMRGYATPASRKFFLDVIGGAVSNAEIRTDATYPLGFMRDSYYNAIANTPWRTFIKSANASGGSASLTVDRSDIEADVNVSIIRVPTICIKIASSQLNSVSEQVVKITMTTAKAGDGSALSLGAIDVSYTPRVGGNNTLLWITPWKIVNNSPIPTQFGILATGSPFDLDISVTGLQDGTVVTLLVPGAAYSTFTELIDAMK